MLSTIPKDKLIIGLKQTKKAVTAGLVQKLYLAENCDPMISEPLQEAAQKAGVQVLYVATMKELGSMCAINVGASCAAVLK